MDFARGAGAIAELCAALQALARRLYPLLLWARRSILQFQGLKVDPNQQI
ncbi:MAG: hypothetical protein O2922_08780 [Cyanobacteria bacterium]|nr:hypothetical protein [Cyanobacteriota bacterium]